MSAGVRFEHVDVVFGPRPAEAVRLLERGAGKDEIFEQTGHVLGVRDADFAVERGEIFVLMGLSGSGKSSLLRCVNGLNRVTRGRVLIDDDGTEVDISHCEREVLRRVRMTRISMVFQQFALMPWRTIRENVGFGLEIRGVPRAARDERVMQVLELVHLAQWVDKYPHELSGGMQQRVGLARAFATDAEILLMDEPFSALDPLIREHLQEELLDFQRQLQRTILFVSHDLDEALKIGSRIAIMEGGRIIQIGRPEEIITHPATEYVSQFVANVNPLNVLRGVSLMRPLEELPRRDGGVILDEGEGLACGLDERGCPREATCGGARLRLEPWREDLDLAALDGDVLVTGTPDVTMRVAIEARHATRRAMPLLDGEGRLVGVIGSGELLAGMLRRPEHHEGAPQPAPGRAEDEAQSTIRRADL